ncbi:trefoil factor 2 [Lemur catta]|uniref:trefoil factor 2 n=1 Tax=Lemur catta TaxID=9447 RepID=UPI001E269827|nr:trefoil factor 2 [Lemur catta]
MDMGPRGVQLLAALLVLGLCALAGGEKPSACQCSRVSPKNRKNCGFSGITSDECFDGGCCYDSSVSGVPWCFYPLPKEENEQCVMEVPARVNCGYPGISREQCLSQQCCFDDLVFQVPWCFYPKPLEDCHY